MGPRIRRVSVRNNSPDERIVTGYLQDLQQAAENLDGEERQQVAKERSVLPSIGARAVRSAMLRRDRSIESSTPPQR